MLYSKAHFVFWSVSGFWSGGSTWVAEVLQGGHQALCRAPIAHDHHVLGRLLVLCVRADAAVCGIQAGLPTDGVQGQGGYALVLVCRGDLVPNNV